MIEDTNEHGTPQRSSRHQLDMTPMVDVTFLLLIFFMVTASFTVENAITQNPQIEQLPGPVNPEVPEPDPEFVEVLVDQFNTYRLTSSRLTSSENAGVEAASDQEMRVQLRDMIQASRASQLRIVAHGTRKS